MRLIKNIISIALAPYSQGMPWLNAMACLCMALALAITIPATAQVYQNDPAFGRTFNRIRAARELALPAYQDSANLPALPIARVGSLRTDSTQGSLAYTVADSSLWMYTGYNWSRVALGSAPGASCDSCITSISYRPGNFIDTLVFTNSLGTTDWYYVVAKDGIVEGCDVAYTGDGLLYTVAAGIVRIGGAFYSYGDTTIAVAPLADPDSSRRVVFVANTDGQFDVVNGVEGANVLDPPIDRGSQYPLSGVTLRPTNPTSGIDTVIQYRENLGNGPEWQGSSSGFGSMNFGGTTNPFNGTYTIDAGQATNGDILFLTDTLTDHNQTSFGGQSFYIRLKQIMPSNNNLMISYWNDATQVTNEIAISLNKSNTTTYQGISIAFTNFVWSNSLFNRVRFRYAGNGPGITGFYLDMVYLQNGMVPIVINPGTNFVTNVYRTSNNVFQSINGLNSVAFSLADKADTATTININGTAPVAVSPGAQSLAANRTWTVSADTGRAHHQISTGGGLTKIADSLAALIGYKVTLPYVANQYMNGYGVWSTLNTDSITEGGTNLFYTNARARSAISLTTTGSSGAATYNSSTGVLNVPEYAGSAGINELTGPITAGPGSGSQATTVTPNAITYAMMQQQVGLSVLGNSTNSTANMAAITAANDHFALRRSGTSIGWGLLNAGAMNGTYTNGYQLQTDGSGGLSWVAPATGTVTGTGTTPQIAYWSGSSALTGESGLKWDATENSILLANSTAPNWGGTYEGHLENTYASVDFASSHFLGLATNWYWDGTNSKYKTTNTAGSFYLNGNELLYRNAASGTAGNNITFANRFYIGTNGRVGIGTVSPSDAMLRIEGADASTFSVAGIGTTASFMTSKATSSTGEAGISVGNDQASSTAFGSFGIYGSAWASTRLRNNVAFGSRKALIFQSNNITATGGTSEIDFYAGGEQESQRVMRIAEKTVSINGQGTTTKAGTSIVLDITSTTGAVRLPRMTHTQAGALTASDGMIIYVTSTDATFTAIGVWARENGAWIKL